MGWQDYHLWEFTIARQRYGLPSDEDFDAGPDHDASKVRLRDVLTPRRTTLGYTYDFGDNWKLRLTVTSRRPAEPDTSYPRYVAGERNAPPEDCGGVYGFYKKLKTRDDPNDPDYKDIKRWLGTYDPNVVDEATIRATLGLVAARRTRRRRRAAKRESDGAV